MRKNKEMGLVSLVKTVFDGEEVTEVEPNLKVMEVGETVRGVFNGISEENEEGRRSVFIKGDTGEIFCLPLSASLVRKLSNIGIGDYVIISRTEDVKTKAGRTAKTFRVFKKG